VPHEKPAVGSNGEGRSVDMNQERFERFERAISDERLEEAQQLPARKLPWRRFGMAAACVCTATTVLI
ncbi:hypothetical protein, partial [Salmonella enterica]|uniref:hypothetical protein n=1 Tax=Salmonella enterica TaxID=28901 RepID=UPI003297D1E6